MGVLVDRVTYEKYQSVPAGDIRSLVQLHVSLNPVGATDTLYAKIDPTASNDCPFLATDRLCGMQKEFGPEYLSATCSIYPRVLNSVDDELETSLYLSCPEAARLVLLNPDSTESEGNVASSHFRTDQFSRLVTSDQNSIHKPYSYFDEIRVFVVNLIHNRTRPMWQRLFLLGMLCRDLDEINAAEKDSNVPRILNDYKEILSNVALYREMENVPARTEKQLDLVLRLTDKCILGGASGARFETCFQEFLRGIGYSPKSTVASATERYVEAEERFCQPFLEQHPFIMENYLLNYVFRTLFPFGREASAHHTPQNILSEYTMMATQYALIKGLLIGMAGHYQGGFSSEHVVRLVQSFSKAVEHNLTYLNEIKKIIQSQNLCTPEGILILLKCSTVESCRLVTERRPILTRYSTHPAIAI
jgi:lysine-N-methylase